MGSSVENFETEEELKRIHSFDLSFKWVLKHCLLEELTTTMTIVLIIMITITPTILIIIIDINKINNNIK